MSFLVFKKVYGNYKNISLKFSLISNSFVHGTAPFHQTVTYRP